MKIGLIVPGFSAHAADWCIPVLVDVVRELSQRADVHVFALRYPPRRERYRVHGAEVHALGGGALRGLRRPGLLASAWARILAEHRRSPFGALHGLWVDEPGFVAVTAARLLGIPALVSVMGGELVAMPEIGYGGHLSASNRLLSALSLRGADCATAGSTQAADLARRALQVSMLRGSIPATPRGDDRIARLVWGIDPHLFEPRGPTRNLAGDLRVLHVGSLVPIKDQATLLRAAARLKETEPGVHLHMVGDGPLQASLSRLAHGLDLASSVTFHGHVDRGELAAYYRAAHVVAVSSRFEAQLVVVLESALCGTPIVGTAVGLVADFAPEAAMAVPVGDATGLADAIRAATQAKTRQALATEARRRAMSDCVAAETAERLLSMYRNPAMAEPAA